MNHTIRALLVCLLCGGLSHGEFTYPPEKRGECTATLTVAVADTDDNDGLARVHLTVAVEGPVGLVVDPVQVEDAWKVWEVRVSSAWRQEDRRTVWSQVVALKQTAPGVRPLPSVRVGFRASPTSPTESVQWREILGRSRDAITPDPPPPAPPPTRLWQWVVFAIVCVVLALVGGWGWLRLARKEPVPLLPHEQATLEIAHLEEQSANQTIDWFATRLHEILRRYLAARFDTPALQQTTRDLLADLSVKSILPEDQHRLLSELLEQMDRERFSPARSQVETRQWAEQARELIRQTS